jgi:hypothetical protein
MYQVSVSAFAPEPCYLCDGIYTAPTSYGGGGSVMFNAGGGFASGAADGPPTTLAASVSDAVFAMNAFRDIVCIRVLT